MTYQEAADYLNSLVNYEKIPEYSYKESLKLERFYDFLETVGNPQEGLRFIHVAGSKGKGSTCAFIAHILKEAGYSVGLYTSPHLVDFRERIRILTSKQGQVRGPRDFQGMITRCDIARLVCGLRKKAEAFFRHSRYGAISFFEAYTALAFLYFQEKKPDFIVLETGMGGRLDATNVVRPLVSVITPISLEHTQKLGKTLSRIAFEKAGIIKAFDAGFPARPLVISAPQKTQALKVISKRAKDCAGRLFVVGKEAAIKKDKTGRFMIKGVFKSYPRMRIRLLGDHQLTNAACAVSAVDALGFYGFDIGVDRVRRGLYNTVWPGRCEVVCRKPLIILDGAQNQASSQSLVKAIRDNFPGKKIILLLGISKDKDIRGICECLGKFADRVILTMADNPRAAHPQALTGFFKGTKAEAEPNCRAATRRAIRGCRRESLVLVAGSLFLVGQVRSYLAGVKQCSFMR